MSRYTIELNDNVIVEQIQNILNKILTEELHSRYSYSGQVISEGIREMIYAHKNEIIDRIVDKSVVEMVKKGLPKLLERMYKDDSLRSPQ